MSAVEPAYSLCFRCRRRRFDRTQARARDAAVIGFPHACGSPIARVGQTDRLFVKYFPIFIDLRGKPVLLVGEGERAARKARLLVRAGASLTIVAALPLSDQLTKLADKARIEIIARSFSPDDVAGKVLVYSATGNSEIDEAVANAARAANVPVNVVDRPDLSTFVTPSIVDRGPLTIAISTGGAAPVLARLVRERIEGQMPAGLAQATAFAERHRALVKERVGTERLRRRIWEGFFEQVLADTLHAADDRRLQELLNVTIRSVERGDGAASGAVYLVGAGPGSPDLLTVRALRLMQQADVIIYDHLVSPEVLDRARREAEWIAVEEPQGCHARSQDELNAIMAQRAHAGQIVVRLKGGDCLPCRCVCGELTYLRARGIRVEVVPGVTASLA